MLKQETIDLIKSDLVAFRYLALSTDKDCKSAYFHHEWSEMLLHQEDHVNMQAFRESAKSAYVLRAFPLHCFAFPNPKRDFIVLIKNNATLAKAKLKEISNELRNNPLVGHNVVKIVEDNANVLSVDVMNEKEEIVNIRMEAYGKGASIRGLSNRDRRPNVLLLDDIQDLDDARSDTVCESDWNWFLSDIVFLGENARIFYIANNLGEKCISERLMRAELETIVFKKVVIPQLLNDEPTWKERGDTIEKIKAEREDYTRLGKLDIWFREKMCIAVSQESRSFQETDFRYYEWGFRERIIKECNIFATLDPASSQKQNSCYRAIVINGVNIKNFWHILGVKYGRWGSDELINQIFNTVEEYGLRDFYIEKGQIEQILEPIIMNEQRLRNVFFNLKPLEHAKEGTKVERVNGLQPYFKSHSVLFPPDSKAPYMMELKTELAGVTRDEIKSMYIDVVDALAMQIQVAKPPHNKQNTSVVIKKMKKDKEDMMEYDRKAEPYTLELSPEEVERLRKEKEELLKQVTPNPDRIVRQTKVMVKL